MPYMYVQEKYIVVSLALIVCEPAAVFGGDRIGSLTPFFASNSAIATEEEDEVGLHLSGVLESLPKSLRGGSLTGCC